MRWLAEIDDVDRTRRYGKELLGYSIRRERRLLGWSQRMLAWRVGVAQSTISRLEAGTIQGMRLGTLALITGILGVGDPSAGIRFGEEPPAPRRRLPRDEVAPPGSRVVPDEGSDDLEEPDPPGSAAGDAATDDDEVNTRNISGEGWRQEPPSPTDARPVTFVCVRQASVGRRSDSGRKMGIRMGPTTGAG